MWLKGARIAELVELWLKSQVQCWCGFESLMQQGIFLPESTFSADSLTVFVQPLCAIAWLNICVCVKNPQTLAAIPLFGHMEIQHTLIGTGSAALVAAAPCSGKVTQISLREQWNIKKEEKKKKGKEEEEEEEEKKKRKKRRKKKKKKKKKEDDLQDTVKQVSFDFMYFFYLWCNWHNPLGNMTEEWQQLDRWLKQTMFPETMTILLVPAKILDELYAKIVISNCHLR